MNKSSAGPFDFLVNTKTLMRLRNPYYF